MAALTESKAGGGVPSQQMWTFACVGIMTTDTGHLLPGATWIRNAGQRVTLPGHATHRMRLLINPFMAPQTKGVYFGKNLRLKIRSMRVVADIT
jgi:hypothetical protein